VSQAVKWLQSVAGVGEDGVIGPLTMAAVAKLDGSAAAAYSGIRLDFMTNLPTWGAFGRGWARRIASNLKGA
jgi:lysozyme family protein